MIFYLNYLLLFSYESHDTLTHENREFIRISSGNRDPISIMEQPCVTHKSLHVQKVDNSCQSQLLVIPDMSGL